MLIAHYIFVFYLNVHRLVNCVNFFLWGLVAYFVLTFLIEFTVLTGLY